MINLLSLLDDIAATMDDVAVMTKVALKKTSALMSDDLAVNAGVVHGVESSRELPIVLKIFFSHPNILYHPYLLSQDLLCFLHSHQQVVCTSLLHHCLHSMLYTDEVHNYKAKYRYTMVMPITVDRRPEVTSKETTVRSWYL